MFPLNHTPRLGLPLAQVPDSHDVKKEPGPYGFVLSLFTVSLKNMASIWGPSILTNGGALPSHYSSSHFIILSVSLIQSLQQASAARFTSGFQHSLALKVEIRKDSVIFHFQEVFITPE